ncbi:MAG: nucleotide sugar dehydrogenase [Gemmatimonadota bacterium]
MTSQDGVLLQRIESKEAVCGIVGLGYVGLPLAMTACRAGYRVLGFDLNPAVVNGVNGGRSHVLDVKDAELSGHVTGGLMEATTDLGRLGECDAVIICVPTPLSKTRDPDVSFVVAATEAVRDTLRAGQVVILESTTYPGTTRELMQPILEQSGLRAGEDFYLCFSPERVDPGNPNWHVQNTPKVIGGISAACQKVGVALYSRIMDTVVPVSSPEAAELTKLLENTFRAINIALVNEMAQAADRLGVDIWEVIDAASTKPFGYMKFLPGPGIGGHCIPLDPHYLAWKMKTLRYRMRLVELASEINADMPAYVVVKVQDALNHMHKSLAGARVLVLGVAYKRDIDDVRESPAIDIIQLLREKGADVAYHDPYVAEMRAEGLRLTSVALTEAELEAADCVLVVTDHEVIDYATVAEHAKLVVDTRNIMADLEGDHIVGLSGRVQRA